MQNGESTGAEVQEGSGRVQAASSSSPAQLKKAWKSPEIIRSTLDDTEAGSLGVADGGARSATLS